MFRGTRLSRSPPRHLGAYWDLARQTLTSMQLSIDDRMHQLVLADAPWQGILPTGLDQKNTRLFRQLQRDWSDMLTKAGRPEERLQSLLYRLQSL